MMTEYQLIVYGDEKIATEINLGSKEDCPSIFIYPEGYDVVSKPYIRVFMTMNQLAELFHQLGMAFPQLQKLNEETKKESSKTNETNPRVPNGTA